MIVSLSLALLALAPPTTVLQPPMPRAVVEDDEELPDKRPEVKELIDNLKDHVGERGQEDKEVVDTIDLLVAEFPNSGPRDRKAIIKALDKVLKAKRKERDEGPDNGIHIAAGTALGTMGPESVKTLVGWIDKKPHEKDMAVQRALILALGRTADEGGVKILHDLMRHDRPEVQAATAEAIANYASAEQETRKELFKTCLDVLMSIRSILDQDQANIIERDRWDVISGPIFSTLSTLSGFRGNQGDAHAWQHWWNKNKKEDWDEGFDG